MPSPSWLLHFSDLHLGDVSPGQTLTDEKEVLQGQRHRETTQEVLKRTLARMERYVTKHGAPNAVVISGDLTYRGRQLGFDHFSELLDDYDFLWPDRSNVVVVPGNHDVAWPEPPGTPKRYAGFISVTRDRGCSTPLLDGVDFDVETGRPRSAMRVGGHVIETEDFVVIPINSSNFCGVFVDPASDDRWTRERWTDALALLPDGGSEALAELDFLRQKDMARVSRLQIEALENLLTRLGIDKKSDGRPRFAAIHHQLLPVSTREELKSFEALINLGLVRQMLREYEVDVVLHGHKHETALFWDFLRNTGDSIDTPPRRVLVAASPGQFNNLDPVMRAFHVRGNPRARNLRVVRFKGPATKVGDPIEEDEALAPIWTSAMEVGEQERCMIRASSANVTYARLRAFFEGQRVKSIRNLVCQIDNPSNADQLPDDYPELPAALDPETWFGEIVDWWQLGSSQLLREGKVRFNHGERIRTRFGDQIDRAARALKQRSGSSRAIIVLIDPRETGHYEKDRRDLERGQYPAFALAEFAITERNNRRELDCFGYFRKQEIQYWWPINVAELALLQAAVADGLKGVRAGRIVTFSGIAQWDTALPWVAVPEIDRLTDYPERLEAMAAAVVFPTKATSQAVGDWARVLTDLQGGDPWPDPPTPSLGHTRLLAEIVRLQKASGSPEGRGVVTCLARLNKHYDVLADVDGDDAAEMREDHVIKLRKAVRKVLPDLP